MSKLDRLTPLHLAAFSATISLVAKATGCGEHPPERGRNELKRRRSLVERCKEKRPDSSGMTKFIKFLLVGGLGVGVNSLALFVLHQLMRFPLVVASLVAVELAIVNNFFWNDRWTFGRKKHSFRRFFQFNLVSCGGLVITTGTLWVLVTHLAAPYLLANLVGIGLATCWNFGINLLWTWGSV
jgi:putative flippase GtrA